MPDWVYRCLDRIGSRLLPPRCVLCRDPGAAPGRDLCAGCEADLPRLEQACPRCGLAVANAVESAAGCAACREQALPYDRLCAAFPYAFPIDQMIPALKYQGTLAHARVLGLLLAEAVARRGLQHAVDLLVPMPLHPDRLVDRGYNQAREIARFVAATLDVRMEDRVLQRTRSTSPQVGLEQAARRRNVEGAFAASTPPIEGKRVALLDDVVTTGSTVGAAAMALRHAGARGVDVWCVARALA